MHNLMKRPRSFFGAISVIIDAEIFWDFRDIFPLDHVMLATNECDLLIVYKANFESARLVYKHGFFGGLWPNGLYDHHFYVGYIYFIAKVIL